MKILILKFRQCMPRTRHLTVWMYHIIYMSKKAVREGLQFMFTADRNPRPVRSSTNCIISSIKKAIRLLYRISGDQQAIPNFISAWIIRRNGWMQLWRIYDALVNYPVP